jgi:hypothetical protein
MNKIILSILLTVVSLQAGLVNAIAITINETPITLYDIDTEMQTNNISRNDAVSRLIDDILYEQSLSTNRISVDAFDIDNYIEKIAARNKMNIFDFKSLVKQQEDYTLFREKIKKQIIHQKLISKISNGKLIIATEEDLEIYYKNNQEQFKIADTIDVVAYVTKNKKLLKDLKANPMLQNKQILVQNITMKQSELNPQTKYILNSTSEKTFSAIFAQNKNYNMFYIQDKKDITSISFENVKEKIFQIIMKKREKDYLKDYFETSKITADIKVLR